MTAQAFKITGLGTLECEIMKVLWKRPSASIRSLIEALGNQHAYTTIATVRTNLERKGLVKARRDGRSVYYASQIRRDDYIATQMGVVLSGSESRARALQTFVGKLSDKEIIALRQCLDSMKRNEKI